MQILSWRERDALQSKALLGVRFLITVYIVHCAMNILALSFPPLNIFFYSMLLRFFYLVFKLQSLERCVQRTDR